MRVFTHTKPSPKVWNWQSYKNMDVYVTLYSAERQSLSLSLSDVFQPTDRVYINLITGLCFLVLCLSCLRFFFFMCGSGGANSSCVLRVCFVPCLAGWPLPCLCLSWRFQSGTYRWGSVVCPSFSVLSVLPSLSVYLPVTPTPSLSSSFLHPAPVLCGVWMLVSLTVAAELCR